MTQCYVFDSAANNSFVREFKSSNYREMAKELIHEYDMNFLKEEFNIVKVKNTHDNVIEFTYANNKKSYVIISIIEEETLAELEENKAIAQGY